MRVIDFSYIFFASLHASFNNKNDSSETKQRMGKQLDKKYLRFLIFEKLHSIFGTINGLGRTVLAFDCRGSWRKRYFPFYKAHRKSDREKFLHIDWDEAFGVLEEIKKEITEHTNWEVYEIAGAEADDIIAVLSLKNSIEEDVVIISPDKDFVQLLAYSDKIKIFNPQENRFKSESNPKEFLVDMILRGDRSDGVPNCMSDDDSIINESKKQVKFSDKRYDILRELYINKNEDLKPQIQRQFRETQIKKSGISGLTLDVLEKNFERNRILIDLRCIPVEIVKKILMFKAPNIDNNVNLLEYFYKHSMGSMIEKRNEFFK